jgi:hypothetical protein
MAQMLANSSFFDSPAFIMCAVLLASGVYFIRVFFRLESDDDTVWSNPLAGAAVFIGLIIVQTVYVVWMLPYFGEFPLIYRRLQFVPSLLYVPFFVWHVVHAFREGFQFNPPRKRTEYTPPQAAEARGEWTRAEALWKEEIERSPNVYEPYDHLARLYRRMGRPEDAARILTRAARNEALPEGARTHARLAAADNLEAAGDPAGAGAMFRWVESEGGSGAETARRQREAMETRLTAPPPAIDRERDARFSAMDIEADEKPPRDEPPAPEGMR